MKRAFFFLAIALLGVIYYAAGSPMEVADRVMIHAMGIDPEKDGYTVTLQVFAPSGGGSETAIDPSQPNVSTVSGKGADVAAAVHDCESKLGGRVFIGQNRIVIFGRDTDLTESEKLFGYFLSSSEAYLSTDCAAAEDTAAELLSVPIPSSGITSDRFVTMINSECERGCSARCTLMQLLEANETEGACALMPEFSLLPESGGSSSSEQDSGDDSQPEQLPPGSRLILEKCAVFAGGRYAGELSGSDAGLVGMINGSGQNVYTVTGQDGRRMGNSFRITARTAEASQDGGDIIIRVDCTADPRDEQYFPNSTERSRFLEAARAGLSERANDLAAELCGAGCAGLLGADRAIRRDAPELIDGSPAELYPRVRYDIRVR